MCGTCGCSGHDHNHDHHDHHHDHNHDHHNHTGNPAIELERDILSRNNTMAERVRGYLEAKEIEALNLMSSPGSGKTTLLEQTIQTLKGRIPLYVIEGDQQTSNDADRIKQLDIPAVQINTGSGCHLEADMVYDAIKKLNPVNHSLLFIENVGNLVCPAVFNLGENLKVVIISTTEGEDKPLKYPQMFYEADICIINKIDLLPYLKIDLKQLRDNLHKVNHHLKVFELSALTGEGMQEWCEFLIKRHRGVSESSPAKEFFNERAAGWDQHIIVDEGKINRLLGLLKIKENASVLDVGTGTGVLIPFLLKALPHGQITAVDFSSEMLREARRKFGADNRVYFRETDIEKDPLQGQFDAIILYSVFPHFENKTETISKLVKTNLKPEGKLLIAHSQGRETLNNMHNGLSHGMQSAHLLNIEQQQSIFKDAGLTVEKAYEDNDIYYLIVKA